MFKNADPEVGSPGVTRRSFVGGASGAFFYAGLTGGSLAPTLLRAATPVATATATPIGILLNDKHAGYAMSVSGGSTVFPPPGPDSSGTVRERDDTPGFREVSLVLHSLDKVFLDWMTATLTSGNTGKVNVTLAGYDAAGMEWHRLILEDVMLSGFGLDAIDLASTEPARFSVDFLPARIRQEARSDRPPTLPAYRIAPVVQSSCRMYIQGLESATPGILKISPVKMTRQANFDVLRQTWMRTSWRMEPLTISVVPALAKDIYGWAVQSAAGAAARNGQLQLLNRDLTKVAASVGFTGLQLTEAASPFPEQGFAEPALARTRFELESTTLPTFALGGLLG